MGAASSSLEDALATLFIQKGIDFCGAIAVDDYENRLMEYSNQQKGDWLNPKEYFPSGSQKSIVVMGKKIVKGNLVNPGKYTARHNITVNEQLNSALFDTCKLLEHYGYETFGQFTIVQNFAPPQDFHVLQSDVIPSKVIAKLAGLGEIGWHNLFIHTNYGACVRLTTLITEASPSFFKQNKRDASAQKESKRCDFCFSCVEACPVKAISKTGGYDANQCWKYNHYLQSKWGYSGCGLCMYYCK